MISGLNSSHPLPNLNADPQPLPNLNSDSQPLSNLDSDLLPRYTEKLLDSLTCSSPYHHTMAGRYDTVTAYIHLMFTIACLISGLGSMPVIDLCTGAGSIAGTIALSAGFSLLLNAYFRRGFPPHELPPDDDAQAPFSWRLAVYYFLNFAFPFLFAIIFGFVLQFSINRSCAHPPAGCICNSTASNLPLHTGGHTLTPTETAR